MDLSDIPLIETRLLTRMMGENFFKYYLQVTFIFLFGKELLETHLKQKK